MVLQDGNPYGLVYKRMDPPSPQTPFDLGALSPSTPNSHSPGRLYQGSHLGLPPRMDRSQTFASSPRLSTCSSPLCPPPELRSPYSQQPGQLQWSPGGRHGGALGHGSPADTLASCPGLANGGPLPTLSWRRTQSAGEGWEISRVNKDADWTKKEKKPQSVSMPEAGIHPQLVPGWRDACGKGEEGRDEVLEPKQKVESPEARGVSPHDSMGIASQNSDVMDKMWEEKPENSSGVKEESRQSSGGGNVDGKVFEAEEATKKEEVEDPVGHDAIPKLKMSDISLQFAEAREKKLNGRRACAVPVMDAALRQSLESAATADSAGGAAMSPLYQPRTARASFRQRQASNPRPSEAVFPMPLALPPEGETTSPLPPPPWLAKTNTEVKVQPRRWHQRIFACWLP